MQVAGIFIWGSRKMVAISHIYSSSSKIT